MREGNEVPERMTRAPIEKERVPIESERSVSKSTRSPMQDERVLTKREVWSSVKERMSFVSKPIVTEDERMLTVSKRFPAETEGSFFVSKPMLSPSTRVPIVGERVLTVRERSLSMGTRIFIVSIRLFTGREGFPIVGDGLLIEDMGVLSEDVRVLGEDMRVSSEEVGSFTRGTRVSPVKQRPALAYHGSIMRCERHDLVLAPDGTCVLCRRDAQIGSVRRGKRRLVAAVATAIVAVAALFAARRIAREVKVDPELTLVLGHSGGASSAPYVATNDPFYKAFAVLHGGAFPRGLGPNHVRGWFSTGEDDPLRPVAGVEKAAGSVYALGLDVSFHTFPEGHGVSPAELDAVLRWWLEK